MLLPFLMPKCRRRIIDPVMKSVTQRFTRRNEACDKSSQHNSLGNKHSHDRAKDNCDIFDEIRLEIREQKPDNTHGLQQDPEDHPNYGTYKRIERIIQKLQDERYGVPIRTVKGFMSKIPSIFTGSDLVTWLTSHLDVDDQAAAIHLAHLIAAHGYIFPIDDHVLTVKNDATAYYRFQSYFPVPRVAYTPTRACDACVVISSVYLCKRTMQNKQRLELADYEAESLAKLQKGLARKWEFICMNAEAQAKADKKREKVERKILDSQERAFWDVHRPAPGCICTTEIDMRKACKMHTPNRTLKIEALSRTLERRRVRVSKVAEGLISLCGQYTEHDPLLKIVETSNPWITDSTEYWDQDSSLRDISTRRVKRWGFSIREVLRDPAGREQFARFLDKEFSRENLQFWEACQRLKWVPLSQLQPTIDDIFDEFLAPGAKTPINIDARVAERTREQVMSKPGRYCFEAAEDQIFSLMSRDSYNRFIRSDQYKEEVLGGFKKKASKRWFVKAPSTSGPAHASGSLSAATDF